MVGHKAGRLLATVMVGYDGHRGIINYLAVDPQFSGNGFGLALVPPAENFYAPLAVQKSFYLCGMRKKRSLNFMINWDLLKKPSIAVAKG